MACAQGPPIPMGNPEHPITQGRLSQGCMPRGDQSKGTPSGTCTAHILAGRAVADGIRSTWGLLGSLIRLSFKLSETAR
jgi:hypothetical protein